MISTRKRTFIILIVSFVLLASGAFAATFSGANLPLDSSMHLGLINGPGTGVGVGADIFFPFESISYGGEIETQVTNSEYEQDINILKYGLALKYVVSDDLYLTFHIGRTSFYLSKAVDYTDSFSGDDYTIGEDTHGSASYVAFAPNIRVGEFFLMPKIVLNNITDGGTIAEFDLNLGHKF